MVTGHVRQIVFKIVLNNSKIRQEDFILIAKCRWWSGQV